MRHHGLKLIVLGSLAIAAVFLTARTAAACCVPDPNNFVVAEPLVVTIQCPTFPAADPNSNTCACGITLPDGATATGVQVLDLAENPIPEFLGFSANAGTAAELQSLNAAAPGTSWSGFNSALDPNDIPIGPALLRFSVSAPGMTAGKLKADLHRMGLVGAAQADLGGVNFDPSHTTIFELGNKIPTLSEWGMTALVAVILLGGITMVMRRRRQARTL